ncbi:CfaE/CblD family pilus tip adhesin [Candidatus Erwinia dacicola]|uniref:CblD like pilus biogenesis initiator family protein n=1 Tax=Candidatus Erwinia dacicola TaxID=252393 RepID=A0A328TMN4_9GAMM|nr:CfaE/CblD family pilus tip adhesin [Candidatus Erwinia dacicola]NJC99896.1 phage tail protein [Candidatus Erwinia dacicola]RAP71827.1 cblD like pilus biogenesis initiator family protein [Candidatus Erwinia dacicola]
MKIKSTLKLFTMISSIISFSCMAVYESPVSRTTTLTAEFDKSSLPDSLTIWNNLSGGRDDTDGQKWGRNTLVCLSTTDTTNGACNITPYWSGNNPPAGSQNISLLFTNKKTNQSVNINIVGMHQIVIPAGCHSPYSFNYPASVTFGCAGSISVENKFTYKIPRDSLSSLSTPGIWQARLKQNLMLWSSNPNTITVWTADITLNVTDVKNQKIYFPAFPSSAPLINLNLSNRPGTPDNIVASGVSTLDMCLYDGKNSMSSQINMIFRDEGSFASKRPEGLFSVYLDDANKSQTTNRIDYQLSVINPTNGQVQVINNGDGILWENTNTRRIQRLVVIPGMHGASLCVPAPLTITVPQFRLADKSAGRYSGKLTVIYTPSTQTNVSN